MTAEQNSATARDLLERKLRPETVRRNLVLAGLLLTGWELLKEQIVEQVKGFYLTGFDETGMLYPEYEREVLSRHKYAFEASLLWLVEGGALTEEQAKVVRELRARRNDIAHELPKMLVEPGHDIDPKDIRAIQEIVRALGRFWGGIEVDMNPDFDDRDVDPAEIRSGVDLLMTYLVDVAEESDPASR